MNQKLKLFIYPSKILFYSASVHVRTVTVVYFITMVATNRNEELLIGQVINTDQTSFKSNRVGYNHSRLLTVVTKGTNIKDTNLLTPGTKKSFKRINHKYIFPTLQNMALLEAFVSVVLFFLELLILKKGKMFIVKILNPRTCIS